MLNDRKITITVGNNRRSVNWQPLTLMLSEFYDKLRVPNRSAETMATYLTLSKSEQDDKKDIGGFIAGSLNGPRRKAGTVTGRDMITLDFDNIQPGQTNEILKRVDNLGCGYCIYSTRKHTPATPRLRILFPLDRTAAADEYEPVARLMAQFVGIEFADPTTFEATRLMYWPSCCSDSEYVFTYGDNPMVSVDGLLAALNTQIGDWHDVSKWPQVPGAENAFKRLAARQANPQTKNGIVGAFCRTYDIYSAMDTFLAGVYIPVDESGNRYTYSGGSTTGGAVIYDNGLFLYSHHSTDPCGGKLVNAFDLVRIHKFSELDNDANPNTPVGRLPSYQAMSRLAVEDSQVAQLLARERAEAAIQDFGPLQDTDLTNADLANQTDDNLVWAAKLELNLNGGVKPTIDNIWQILEHDPRLKSKFALNEFASRGEVLGELPWSPFTERRAWADNDNQGLYWFFEKYYKITANGKIDAALSLHSEKHKFNEVRDYLCGLKWDGIPRLDTLFIDYLGANDTPYVRAATRKSFTAAVARALAPGCKYDAMVILTGPQGIGKSTLLDKMSKGWFNDNIRTFEGKEASELLQGKWLIEIGELDAFRLSDTARIKQFLSLTADRFRAAYARHVKDIPRCCVFFGTTNSPAFLRDRTGNRRFWPIDVGLQPHEKTVWENLDSEIDQIWAEAVLRWRLGESLFFTGEIEAVSREIQEVHREVSAKEGVIFDFIDKPVPEDWQKWSLDKRRIWLNGDAPTADTNLVQRDRVCALEIWCEAFGGQPKDFKYNDAAEINDILRALPNWERAEKTTRFGYCGPQRGFLRKM